LIPNEQNDMLDRQRMEAMSLASNQMLENDREAPVLFVSFPFPEVFDQVKQSIPLYRVRQGLQLWSYLS